MSGAPGGRGGVGGGRRPPSRRVTTAPVVEVASKKRGGLLGSKRRVLGSSSASRGSGSGVGGEVRAVGGVRAARGSQLSKESAGAASSAPTALGSAAPKTPAAPMKASAPAAKKMSAEAGGGMVLRTLTKEEMTAREQALDAAQGAEEEARRASRQEEARRAKEEERRAREREAEVLREEGARARREEEEAARRHAEEASRRLEAEAEGAGGAPGAREREEGRGRRGKAGVLEEERTRGGGRKVERRRREGKADLARALESEGEDGRRRSLASMRRRLARERGAPPTGPQRPREVVVPETIVVQDLASRMAVRAGEVVRKLMNQGVVVKAGDVVDADTAQLLAEEFGMRVKRVSEDDVLSGLGGEPDDESRLIKRAPVVAIMGHVDHGKTTLLDALRKTDVAGGEEGGITQRLGAWRVKSPTGDWLTFLDTPGHEAFSSMRARAGDVTDIVVLVVAADDGVMPQTLEAIAHTKASGSAMVVAITKCDAEEADSRRVKEDLLRHEVAVEGMGGEVLCVETSAKTGLGLKELEEALSLQADVLELRADPGAPAQGVVVEARVDKGRGQTATVLVKRGTLKRGDVVVAGASWGKVRTLEGIGGEKLKGGAGPSEAVELWGLTGSPEAGDAAYTVETEARAREVADYVEKKRGAKLAASAAQLPLEEAFAQAQGGGEKELLFVVRADVYGVAQALSQAVEKKVGEREGVKARMLLVGAGEVNESDVALAQASGARVLAFDVQVGKKARDLATRAGVEVSRYGVIYEALEDVDLILRGALGPRIREERLGEARLLEVFGLSGGKRKVAGCRVEEGVVRQDALVRVMREGVVCHEGALTSLRRFRDEVKEVNAGLECGLRFESWHDFKVGDVVESYMRVEEE